MSDFAKLFEAEGIGQILATLDENDDEDPCVTFRIPDTAGCRLQMSVGFQASSYDLAERKALAFFNALDLEHAVKTVAPLQEAAASLGRVTP